MKRLLNEMQGKDKPGNHPKSFLAVHSPSQEDKLKFIDYKNGSQNENLKNRIAKCAYNRKNVLFATKELFETEREAYEYLNGIGSIDEGGAIIGLNLPIGAAEQKIIAGQANECMISFSYMNNALRQKLYPTLSSLSLSR